MLWFKMFPVQYCTYIQQKQDLKNEFEIESLTDLARVKNSIIVFLQANPFSLQNKTMHYFSIAEGFIFIYLRKRSR